MQPDFWHLQAFYTRVYTTVHTQTHVRVRAHTQNTQTHMHA